MIYHTYQDLVHKINALLKVNKVYKDNIDKLSNNMLIYLYNETGNKFWLMIWKERRKNERRDIHDESKTVD